MRARAYGVLKVFYPDGSSGNLDGVRWFAWLAWWMAACGPRLLPGDGDGDGSAEGSGSDDGESSTGEPPPPDLPEIPPPACDAAPIEQIAEPVIIDTGVPGSQGGAFWDPVYERVLVFGGLRGSGLYFDDVLAIDPITHATSILQWADGPTFELTDVAAAYDPFAHRWIFVGGEHGGGLIQDVLEVVAIDEITVAGHALPSLPSEITRHTAAFDIDAQRVVYTGGWDGFGPDTDYRNDTWALGAGSWEQLAGGSPPPPSDLMRVQGIPTLGIIAVAPIDPENSTERGLWQLPPGSAAWQPLAISASFPGTHRSSLLWDEESCTLLVWDWGTEGTVWRIDPFTLPATVVEIGRPSVPELDVLYGPNLALVPGTRTIVLHGGANYEDVDSYYPERAAFYPSSP